MSKPASLFIKILVHYCSIVWHYGRCHPTALQLHDRCYHFWLMSLTLAFKTEQNLIWFWETVHINLQCEKLLCERAANLKWKLLQLLWCPSLKERTQRILGCTRCTREKWNFYFRILLGKQLLSHSLTTQRTSFCNTQKGVLWQKPLFAVLCRYGALIPGQDWGQLAINQFISSASGQSFRELIKVNTEQEPWSPQIIMG